MLIIAIVVSGYLLSYIIVILQSIILPKYQKREKMPDEKSHHSTTSLHNQQLDCQSILPLRSKPYQPEIQNGEVGRLENRSVVILLQLDQRQEWDSRQDLKKQRLEFGRRAIVLFVPLSHTRLQETCPGIESRQPMARTGDHAEQLGRRVEEIKDLRDDQEQQRFTEVAKDAYDRKNHPCEIAVRVPDEHLCRVPIVPPEGQ